ncbi:hypothetical protein WJX73_008039 [Symbiochloris irregularis]|uniref:Aminopeptidase N-like N-terminal domain-containing protein n=1 Tax=Symbiochloris irregularis TaxID=706552 RepID=A0AAW1NF54_9CHLO
MQAPSGDRDDEQWLQKWEIPATAEYIVRRGFKRVTLQLPDHLLKQAFHLSHSVQQACKERGLQVQVYVLADTSYNSEGVDEVAALHVQGDCVVHYGTASLSPVSRLPTYFVFGRVIIDAAATAQRILQECEGNPNVQGCAAIVVVPDQGAAGNTDPARGIGPYTWKLPPASSPQDCAWVWVGPDDSPVLSQLQMSLSGCHWAMLDPSDDSSEAGGRWQEGLPLDITRTLKRRYYLVEKARNANIIGILVGTLGVAGYQGVVDAVRKAAKGAGKKTYTLLAGRPTPQKLANFPEIEVFVMIADPQGQILDSKEFLAPIITPQEALQAFSPDAASASETWESGGQLAEVRDATDYFLSRRHYKGLEAPSVGAAAKEAALAVPGRVGRAAGSTWIPFALARPWALNGTQSTSRAFATTTGARYSRLSDVRRRPYLCVPARSSTSVIQAPQEEKSGVSEQEGDKGALNSMAKPQPVYRKDYKPTPYLIDQVHLTFQLGEEHTTVLSDLHFKPNYQGDSPPEVVLNGRKDLKLQSVKVDGKDVPQEQYEVSEKLLMIRGLPKGPFNLQIETQIKPQDNTSLEGLYKSSGNFCTQCEAEGFRGITYFYDRPDVLAKYTTRIEAPQGALPCQFPNPKPCAPSFHTAPGTGDL